MKAFHAPETDAHDPEFFLLRGRPARNEERAGRAALLLKGLAVAGLSPESPPEHGRGPLLAVHTPDFLSFLETAHAEWSQLPGAGPEVIPNIHPQRGWGSYPKGIVGRAGWHMADCACPIGPHSARAAFRAADCAVAAADAVLAGDAHAYALCRPPGHHAYADMAGGHCLLNNAAVAAARLRRAHERVAVLDIDVHHGNGTQGIFYARGDVLTVSVHADPSAFYPFYCGYAHERGEGAGAGATLNIPVTMGAGDADWLAAVAGGVARVAAFEPGAVVLSLGLDAHERDPLKGLNVTTPAFAQAARMIAALPMPVVLVQEGGYLSDDLSTNLATFLGGFLAARA